MYDSFVAELCCPNCRTVVSDAEIQTHLRADGSCFRVGDQLEAIELETSNVLDSDYAQVHATQPGRPIRLLDMWFCRACETEQWAMVEIADRTIRRIDAVRLTRSVLEAANFISALNADLLAEGLVDRAQNDSAVVSSVDVLRRHLPQE